MSINIQSIVLKRSKAGFLVLSLLSKQNFSDAHYSYLVRSLSLSHYLCQDEEYLLTPWLFDSKPSFNSFLNFKYD